MHIYPISTNNTTIAPFLPAISTIIGLCEKLDYDIMIVGALARDLLIEHIYDGDRQRATADVDFAMIAENWETHDHLTQQLMENHGYSLLIPPHKFISADKPPIMVDILPFGGIERNRKVSLPPKHEFIVNMSGFKEAYENCIQVRLDDKVTIKIPSLAAYTTLKFFAWSDKGIEESKHVKDLSYLLNNYYFLDMEFIVMKYPDLQNGAFEEISPRALGRKVQKLLISSSEAFNQLVVVVQKELERGANSYFLQIMSSNQHLDLEEAEKKLEESFVCLNAFLKGLLDRL